MRAPSLTGLARAGAVLLLERFRDSASGVVGHAGIRLPVLVIRVGQRLLLDQTEEFILPFRRPRFPAAAIELPELVLEPPSVLARLFAPELQGVPVIVYRPQLDLGRPDEDTEDGAGGILPARRGRDETQDDRNRDPIHGTSRGGFGRSLVPGRLGRQRLRHADEMAGPRRATLGREGRRSRLHVPEAAVEGGQLEAPG